MNLPEVTDVERLTLRPGDALVVRVRDRVTQDVANALKERVRVILGLDFATPILVLDDGARVEVIGQPEEITR